MANIKIIVERFRASSEKSGSRILTTPKGIIRRKPEDDYLYRRTQNQTGIKFFDLGQILLEAIWTDKLFSADANIHQSGNNIILDDIQPEDTAAKAQFYLDFVANLRAEAEAELSDPELFPDGPPADPEPNISRYVNSGMIEAFRRIEKTNANKFYLQVRSVALNTYFTLDAESARWTADGSSAKFEDSELSEGINIRANPFFSFARIGQNAHPDTAKITTEADYDGDEVEFAVGKSDIYFLVPAFCNISNFETGIFYPTTDRADIFEPEILYSFVETLYANYLTFPRILMDSLLADWFVANFNVNKTLATVTPATYNLFYQNSDYLKTVAETRFFKQFSGRVDNGMGGTDPAVITEEKLVAGFPLDAIYPEPPSLPDYLYKEDGVSVQIEPSQYRAAWSATSNPGALLAIIKQGSDWFFAWER